MFSAIFFKVKYKTRTITQKKPCFRKQKGNNSKKTKSHQNCIMKIAKGMSSESQSEKKIQV